MNKKRWLAVSLAFTLLALLMSCASNNATEETEIGRAHV